MGKFEKYAEGFKDIKRHTPFSVRKMEPGENAVGIFLGIQSLKDQASLKEDEAPLECWGIETDDGIRWYWTDGFTKYEFGRQEVKEGDVVGIEHQGKQRGKDGRDYNRSFVRVLARAGAGTPTATAPK